MKLDKPKLPILITISTWSQVRIKELEMESKKHTSNAS